MHTIHNPCMCTMKYYHTQATLFTVTQPSSVNKGLVIVGAGSNLTIYQLFTTTSRIAQYYNTRKDFLE